MHTARDSRARTQHDGGVHARARHIKYVARAAARPRGVGLGAAVHEPYKRTCTALIVILLLVLDLVLVFGYVFIVLV